MRVSTEWETRIIKSLPKLLNRDADVNTQDGYYGNALQVASSGGHEKVVELLINRDADVNARATRSTTYPKVDRLVKSDTAIRLKANFSIAHACHHVLHMSIIWEIIAPT